MTDQKPVLPDKLVNARRSQRVLVRVPIIVRGQTQDGAALSEKTTTLAVNAHGALIALAANVQLGQRLILEHDVAGKKQEATVANVGKKEENQKTEVGIMFDRPAPHFWGIAFPPEDWQQWSDQTQSGTSDWVAESLQKYLSDK